MSSSLRSTGPGLHRKFWVALALYLVLAVLVWFTIGEGMILVNGQRIELRWIPLLILAAMALKTVLGFQAERIRQSSDGKSR